MQNGAKLFLFHTNIHCPNRMLCGLPYLCGFLKCGFSSLLSPWVAFSLFLYSTAISCSLLNFSPGNCSVCCTSPSAFPWAPGTQFISSNLPLLPATVGSIWHHFPSCSGLRGELFILSPFHYFPHLKGLSHGHYLRLGPGCLTPRYSESPLGALLYIQWPRVVFQYANLS